VIPGSGPDGGNAVRASASSNSLAGESVAADRPAAEVAAELGVRVEVVYSATYRVIRRLRRELAGAWD
jgi:hypothetical protein